MLDKIKNIYSSIPKGNLKFLKFIPNHILFGGSYSKFENEVSFDKKRIAENLFNILEYSREFTAYGKENIPKDFLLSRIRNKNIDVIIYTPKKGNKRYFLRKQDLKLFDYVIPRTKKINSYSGAISEIIKKDIIYFLNYKHEYHEILIDYRFQEISGFPS